MKTITKISMQQNGERYNIFLDEAFYCGVCEDTLIKLELKKGMKIDEADLEVLIKEENKNKCFNYAVFLLGRHSYFKKALVDKLKAKEYTEEEINFALEKLETYKYIDDTRLAEGFVRDKKRFSGKGPKYIKNALKMKGVDDETINKSLEEHYSDEEALENCRMLLSKKMDYYKRKSSDTYTLKGKLYAFLAQRGFKGDTIFKAIEEALRKEECDD